MWQFWGVFFATDNALYSIAFGTHTKTAKPIDMPFRLMTRVRPRYHVQESYTWQVCNSRNAHVSS